MTTSGPYHQRGWSKSELAWLQGCAGSRALAKQDRLDRLIVETLAPAYTGGRAGKGIRRADQAAAAILADAARLTRIADRDAVAVKAYVTRLVRIANDRAATQRLDAAARRGRMQIAPAGAGDRLTARGTRASSERGRLAAGGSA